MDGRPGCGGPAPRRPVHPLLRRPQSPGALPGTGPSPAAGHRPGRAGSASFPPGASVLEVTSPPATAGRWSPSRTAACPAANGPGTPVRSGAVHLVRRALSPAGIASRSPQVAVAADADAADLAAALTPDCGTMPRPQRGSALSRHSIAHCERSNDHSALPPAVISSCLSEVAIPAGRAGLRSRLAVEDCGAEPDVLSASTARQRQPTGAQNRRYTGDRRSDHYPSAV